MRTPQSIAARVAMVYAGVAAVWILGSGWVALGLPKPWEGIFEIAKGLAFVLVTSIILYIVIARWATAYSESAMQSAESERRLQRVLDTVPVGVVLLDGDARVTFLSPQAEELLGVSATEYVGKPFESLCWADVVEFKTSLDVLLATGSVEGLSLLTAPGDEPRAVIARAASIDPSLARSGWVVALTDASAAHERLERLTGLLGAYRFVAEASMLSGRATDTATLLQHICQLAVAVGGYSAAWAVMRDQESGKFVDACMVGLDAEGEAIAGAMRSGAFGAQSAMFSKLSAGEILINNRLPNDPDSPWRDYAVSRGLGSVAYFAVIERGVIHAAVVLFAAETGHFGVEDRRLINALRNDVAFALDRMALEQARMQAEEALAKSEASYRRLFELNPQPMYVYDRETLAFLAANEAAIKKYGYTAEQFMHMKLTDIRPERDVQELLSHLSRKAPGLDDGGFWTHLDASGREFPVHIYTHEIDWEGRTAELVLVQEVARMA